jgi:hypothetical protein
MSSLSPNTSFRVSSLSSLIILTIILGNSTFDITLFLLLFRSLVVELAFFFFLLWLFYL